MNNILDQFGEGDFNVQRRKKIKSIKLYLIYGRRASTVISKLGYPNRLTLRMWFYEYRDNRYRHKHSKRYQETASTHRSKRKVLSNFH